MANLAAQLINGYEQWLAAAQSQLSILQQEPTDERFEVLKTLEMNKGKAKLAVMEQSELIGSLEGHVQAQVTQYITQLQALNNEIEELLESWYSNASTDMKQTSTQRKILNSYGGAQSSDIVSYYVDSKK